MTAIPFDPADYVGYDLADPADRAIVNADLIEDMLRRGDDPADVPENPLEIWEEAKT